jgi:hypothetical protein
VTRRTQRREPQTHWLLLVLLLVTLLSSLFVAGVIDGQVGEKQTIRRTGDMEAVPVEAGGLARPQAPSRYFPLVPALCAA